MGGGVGCNGLGGVEDDKKFQSRQSQSSHDDHTMACITLVGHHRDSGSNLMSAPPNWYPLFVLLFQL